MKWLSVAAAVVLVVLVMHPGGGHILFTAATGYCKPNCTGMANGVKVPDPKNCSNYYLCMAGNPTDKPVACDPGEIFSPSASECEAGTECVPACLPGGSACQLTCKAPGEIIADVVDCSVYHFCSDEGLLGPFNCPCDRPNFDGVDCVNDTSVCCSGYCEPYCDGSGVFTFIPDPNDCYKYYACDADTPEGPPEEAFHFTCPADQYFSVQVGECVAGNPEPCVTLCDAASVGVGGSSTTTDTTTTTTTTDTSTTTTSTATTSTATTPTATPTDTTTSTATTPTATPTDTTTSTATTSTATTTTATPTATTTSTATTSTATTTTDITTTTGDPTGCVESLTCPAEGQFAACDTCVPQYFECAGAGAAGVLTLCPGNNVFNPVPEKPLCLLESNCPFYG